LTYVKYLLEFLPLSLTSSIPLRNLKHQFWCSNKFEKRYLIFGHNSNIDPPSPTNSHGILPMKYCKVHTKINGQFFVLQVHHLVALIENLFNSCLEPQWDFLSKSKFKSSILILAINYVLTLQIDISFPQTTMFENVYPLQCIKFGNSFFQWTQYYLIWARLALQTLPPKNETPCKCQITKWKCDL
jgi:hypothetical protein